MPVVAAVLWHCKECQEASRTYRLCPGCRKPMEEVVVVDRDLVKRLISRMFTPQNLAKMINSFVGTRCPLLHLSNGKEIYIEGNSITQDEAHEIIISLTETFGTDFEKQELKDKVLEL